MDYYEFGDIQSFANKFKDRHALQPSEIEDMINEFHEQTFPTLLQIYNADRGWVVGDIKSTNILVKQTGEQSKPWSYVFADFGDVTPKTNSKKNANHLAYYGTTVCLFLCYSFD